MRVISTTLASFPSYVQQRTYLRDTTLYTQPIHGLMFAACFSISLLLEDSFADYIIPGVTITAQNIRDVTARFFCITWYHYTRRSKIKIGVGPHVGFAMQKQGIDKKR